MPSERSQSQRTTYWHELAQIAQASAHTRLRECTERPLKDVGWWTSAKLAWGRMVQAEPMDCPFLTGKMYRQNLLHLKSNYKHFLLHPKTTKDVQQPITRRYFPLKQCTGVSRQGSASHTSDLQLWAAHPSHLSADGLNLLHKRH